MKPISINALEALPLCQSSPPSLELVTNLLLQLTFESRDGSIDIGERLGSGNGEDASEEGSDVETVEKCTIVSRVEGERE